MSMPAQSSRTGTDSDSSLSLPTVTQATADNRLATGAAGKVGAGGWQLYRTHSLRLLRLSVRPTVAHTRSRLCHATVLWGAARMPSSNWLQQATVREQLLLPHPFAKYERHQQRRVVDAAASHNTPLHPNPNVAPATPLFGQLNVLSRTLSRSICLSVCPSDLLPPGCSIVLFLLLSTDLNEPQQRPAPSTRP